MIPIFLHIVLLIFALLIFAFQSCLTFTASYTGNDSGLISSTRPRCSRNTR